ncbi:ComF family protein [Ruficoccus amylovorans]|uniref:ComF family protein n=1 Tax=Ruficoccus amylovorans TaxID=1804625 RepID=A0A842HFD0_9BACT|nr:ComF family protein [Ruficoccus amylovorans]MBC2594346.1 ComF family protein [Ruficoccus amylovorans]
MPTSVQRSPLLRTLVRTGLDLIFPRDCVVTGEPVEEDSPCRYLSRKGLEQVFFVKEPCCPTCGFPFFGELLASRVCPHCRELEPAFGRGRPLFLARDAGRVLVHELKYHRGRYLLPDIATLAAGSSGFCQHLAGAVLVPVPLYPRRERQRGYNQSRWLAEVFAGVAGDFEQTPGERCQVADLLTRIRDTPSQTNFDRAQREVNMRGAFGLKPGSRPDVSRRHVLVDDVFTTGATLNACARVLRRAGVERLDVATLAHG